MGEVGMSALRRMSLALGMAGALAAGAATSAIAGGSIKDEPAPAGREFAWSFNIGGTTDYVYRGISQTWEDPAVQGGVDFTYGSFYIGTWASLVKFAPHQDDSIADAEVDFYAGFKPEWRGVTFDFGVIYYTYPAANDSSAELNMVELKAGASGSPITDLTIGGIIYYSPEYTGETGEVWTFEGTAGYQFRQIGMFTPTLGGTLGYQMGDRGDLDIDGFGDKDYFYWNVGLALAVDKMTFDFRYWDTDIGTANGGMCADTKLCDERFVFSAKFTY